MHTKKHQIQFVLICLMMSLFGAVRLELTDNEPQISLTFQSKGKHTFYAVSSGQEIHDIQLMITYGGLLMFNKTGNDLEFSHQFGNGAVNVTIISTDSQPRSVSFDFYSDDDPFVNIIDKKDVVLLEGVLSQVIRSMKTISLNQQFHIERDESHKVTLQESESHIKWTGIVKIAFLLVSALLQLYIMKGFFKTNTGHPYHPVETS